MNEAAWVRKRERERRRERERARREKKEKKRKTIKVYLWLSRPEEATWLVCATVLTQDSAVRHFTRL